MLIVSIGQGGINPLRIYWEDNKEVLRKDGKKKKGGKGKAKVGANSSPSVHPLLQHFYYQRLWTCPRWICVDSELKVIANLSPLFLTATERGLTPGVAAPKAGKQAGAAASLLPRPPPPSKKGTTHLEEPQDRQRLRNRQHLDNFTVRSHEGMGGCWGRGFYNCAPKKNTKKKKKKMMKKNVTNKKSVGVGERSSPAAAKPPPSSAPRSTPSSSPPQPPRPSWSVNFTRTSPPEASTSAILPSFLRVLSHHVNDLSATSSLQLSPFGTGDILVTHSLTGGTGSGVTSRVLEAISDEHPKADIYTLTITPFVTFPPASNSVGGGGGG
ncbi:hypothetical protein TrRE_jg3115, partial [Triparma retinervis]